MNTPLRLTGPTLLLGLTLLAFPGLAREAGSEECKALPGYALDSDPRPRGDEVVVPVVVHMMKNDACRHDDVCPEIAPASSPRSQWTPEKVREHLGENGWVNEPWRKAGIRLAVVRVDECTYLPREDDPPNPDPVNTPVSGRLFEDEVWSRWYDRVNQRFEKSRALNLYVWLRLNRDAGVDGVGSSPLRGLRRAGTNPAVVWPAVVWIDTVCVMDGSGTGEGGKPIPKHFEPKACGRKLAHEVGHALGLQHPNVTAPNESPTCQGLRRDPEKNLMAPSEGMTADVSWESRNLDSWQKCEAKANAVRFFSPR